MIQKIALAFVALVLPFSFMGCGGPSSGDVYDKDHVEAYTSYHSVPDYIWVPQYNPTTKTTDMHQQYVGNHDEADYHEECWKIMFRDSEGKEGDACVSEYKWNDIQIGEYFSKK
jgi:hypothetical protein